MLARSEALKRNQPVQVCRGTLTGSTASCSGVDGAWEGGWLVHLNQSGSLSDPNEVIASRGSLKAGDTLRTSGNVNSISYRPNGSIDAAAVFVLCNSDGDTTTARVIDVAVTGRPRIITGTNIGCDP